MPGPYTPVRKLETDFVGRSVSDTQIAFSPGAARFYTSEGLVVLPVQKLLRIVDRIKLKEMFWNRQAVISVGNAPRPDGLSRKAQQNGTR